MASVGTSYWSRRRRIRANVEKTLQCLAPEDNPDGLNICPFEVPDNNSQADIAIEVANTAVNNVNEASSTVELIQIEAHENLQDDVYDSDGNSSVSSIQHNSDIDKYPSDEELPHNLAQWSMQCNIPQSSLKKLLAILRPYHPSLPIDPRTILSTPRITTVQQFANGGSYYHFGVQNGIQLVNNSENLLSNLEHISVISLQVNIDGLPVFNSSNFQFWPILCLIEESQHRQPFIVGLYANDKKPSNMSDFFKDFVNECKLLFRDGITLSGRHLGVRINCILCDAPARAMVKCVKMHSGYHACDRCLQPGTWAGKVIYPTTNDPLRTDESFANMIDEDYHVNSIRSPLLELNIKMVTQFPIDYMHLICQGVTRRMITAWIKGAYTCRLPSRLVQAASTKLLKLRQHTPREFARRPRSFSDVDRWKATEFRFFLLYAGAVVMKGILNAACYDHFLLLVVAVYCLCSVRLHREFCDYCEHILKLFVEHCSVMYGADFMVYNVHMLIHVVDDVRRYGNLDKISCFPFENYMRQIKKMVRKSHLPLQQVVRRLEEHKLLLYDKKDETTMPKLFGEHENGPVPAHLPNLKQYKRVVMKFFSLTSSERDNCIMLSNGSVCLLRNIVQHAENILLVYEKFTELSDFFTYPLLSSSINIYSVCRLEGQLGLCPLNNVLCKCVCFPLDNTRFVTIPLLHH
jgi:hypothetical protein